MFSKLEIRLTGEMGKGYTGTMDTEVDVWNRMVTMEERGKSHKTPVTTIWTTDFMTREGEGRKVMGDCLRDKPVSWKTRRRLLQTNVGTFP